MIRTRGVGGFCAAFTLAVALAGCGEQAGEAGGGNDPQTSASDGDDAPGLEIEGVDGGVAASGSGDLESDQKVELSARFQDANGHGRIIVELEIEEGWHLNANPASLDFLVPTAVTMEVAGERLDVEPIYPEPTTLEVPLGDGTIEVYEGTATIRVPLPRDRRSVDLDKVEARVELQACNESGRCLAPAVVVEPIEDGPA